MWPEKKNQLYLAHIVAICVIMTVPPSHKRKIPPHLGSRLKNIRIPTNLKLFGDILVGF